MTEGTFHIASFIIPKIFAVNCQTHGQTNSKPSDERHTVHLHVFTGGFAHFNRKEDFDTKGFSIAAHTGSAIASKIWPTRMASSSLPIDPSPTPCAISDSLTCCCR